MFYTGLMVNREKLLITIKILVYARLILIHTINMNKCNYSKCLEFLNKNLSSLSQENPLETKI